MKKYKNQLNKEQYENALKERLRELISEGTESREEIAKRKAELADYIGVSTSALSLYLVGNNFPSTERLLKIANYYECSLDYLIGLSDTRSPNATIQSICEYTGLSERAVDMLHSIKTDGFEGDKTLAVLNLLLSDPGNNKRAAFNDSGLEIVQSMSNRLINLLYSYIFTDSVSLISARNNWPKDKAIVTTGLGLEGLDIEPLYKEHLINSIRDELNKYANKDGKDKGKGK